MSKKGSYIGGHTLLTVRKKNKTKATMGSIKKNRWPYKTIKPDGDFSETLKHLKGNAKKKKFK
jgi:hypothetical protein